MKKKLFRPRLLLKTWKVKKFMYDNHFIKTLDYTFDIKQLKEAYQEIIEICPLHQYDNQISLTHRPNAKNPFYDANGGYFQEIHNQYLNELDYTEFNESFKKTYFYEIYKQLKQIYRIGRCRIMVLAPGKSLKWHRDLEHRIHIPIITGPGALMTFEDKNKTTPTYFTAHFPASGHSYIVDVRGMHTALNGNKDDRIHLLINVTSYADGSEIKLATKPL